MQQITRWQGLKGNACYRFWLTPIQVYLELQRYLRTCSFNCSQLCLYGNNLHTLYMLASTITLMHFIFTSDLEKKRLQGIKGPGRVNRATASTAEQWQSELCLTPFIQTCYWTYFSIPSLLRAKDSSNIPKWHSLSHPAFWDGSSNFYPFNDRLNDIFNFSAYIFKNGNYLVYPL